MNYDYIVAGAGLFGSVFAQRAKEHGKSVLIIEKRDHLGGNCYSHDYEDTKINVHKYGTHIFHTNSAEVWKYINRFTKFNRYQHRVLTTHQNKIYSMPINLSTINSFYNISLKPNEVAAFLESKKGKIPNPQNLEEKAISLIGRDLYETFIKGYTIKQWDCDPKDLPAAIINRLPVRSSYHDAYFDDLYQGMPSAGYTPIFQRMLEGIPIEYGVDFLADRAHWEQKCNKIVYTGAIDAFFDYEYGKLGWRSVKLEWEKIESSDFQGTSVMNYADADIDWTRIHEPKHLHLESWDKSKNVTVISREFSCRDDKEPAYPINSVTDQKIMDKYEKLKNSRSNVIFGGRLADYKYYDMHHVITHALNISKKEIV